MEKIFFIAIVLYSKKNTTEELEEIKNRISNNPTLKRNLHLICIDNRYTKNILQKNGKVKITKVPCFCIRRYDKLEIYSIEEYEKVFQEVIKASEGRIF